MALRSIDFHFLVYILELCFSPVLSLIPASPVLVTKALSTYWILHALDWQSVLVMKFLINHTNKGVRCHATVWQIRDGLRMPWGQNQMTQPIRYRAEVFKSITLSCSKNPPPSLEGPICQIMTPLFVYPVTFQSLFSLFSVYIHSMLRVRRDCKCMNFPTILGLMFSLWVDQH